MNKRATEYDLNDSQLEQLIDKYVDTIVDSMCMKDLQVYVMDDMTEQMHELTFSGILEEIKYTLDDEMLDEFVKQIKGKIQYNAIQITFLNIILNVYVCFICFYQFVNVLRSCCLCGRAIASL